MTPGEFFPIVVQQCAITAALVLALFAGVAAVLLPIAAARGERR